MFYFDYKLLRQYLYINVKKIKISTKQCRRKIYWYFNLLDDKKPSIKISKNLLNINPRI